MVSIVNSAWHESPRIKPGTVFLGDMPNVDHKKFYVIAGVHENEVSVCTVIINSKVNPFVIRNERLRKAQVSICGANYDFLSHDSFVDCAHAYVKESAFFAECKIIGCLSDDDLRSVRRHIVASGMMSLHNMRRYGFIEKAD